MSVYDGKAHKGMTKKPTKIFHAGKNKAHWN